LQTCNFGWLFAEQYNTVVTKVVSNINDCLFECTVTSTNLNTNFVSPHFEQLGKVN